MRLILSSLLVLSSSIAFADNSPPPAPAKAPPSGATVDVRTMATDDCARARKAGKTCVLDIGEEEITGEVATGTGEGFTGIDWGTAGSLIRLRRDFITEILRSAEDID
ncbi:MAG: hypothetical protein AB7T06_40545 [Kofleriaceae bacterium]